MKKIFITIMTALMFLGAPAPKAEASAAMYWYYCGGGPGTDHEGWSCITWLFVGAPIGVAGTVTAFFFPPVGVSLMLLDGDNQSNRSKLERTLTEKFPFIEDQEVVKSLANTMTKIFDSAPVLQGEHDGTTINYKEATLTEQEVRRILAPADLSESQIQLVVNELK